MTDDGLTAEQYTPRVEAALEAWLDYMAGMTADEMGGLTVGMRLAARVCFAAGEDVHAAGCFDALADLVAAMGAARAAIDGGNAR